MPERPAPVRDWRLHLGAHKTATTHLQHTLAAHRDALVADGRDYIPYPDFRAAARPWILPGSWRRRVWGWPLAGSVAARGFEAALDGLRRGPETVLLSDEDLLGYSRDLLAAPLYARPRALHLVAHLAARAQRTTLFLSIRSLDGLLPSAYAQALKSEPYPAGSLERICSEISAAPPSWVDLIARIRTAVPGAELRVWRHEDYRAHWRALIAEFAGGDVGVLPDVPAVRGTASPGPAGVAAAEALDPGLPQRARILKVREIYAAHPAGDVHGRLDPLTEADKARLRASYAEDLEIIGARWPGMLITPAAS